MSKEAKPKLPSDFPRGLIKLALSYMNARDLCYPIMEISKLFNELANDPETMARAFFGQLRVPLDYGGAEFAALQPEERLALMKDVIWQNGANEKLSVVPYFTDGGVSGDNGKYFISNIYTTDNPSYLHSTKRGENVHIKSVCSESSGPMEPSDIGKYKLPAEKAVLCSSHPDDTYMCPIKSLDPQNKCQFAVMKYHDLNRNLSGYTCFLQSFALFLSMEEIDVRHPLVRLFDGVKKMDQMEQLGLEFTSLQSTEDTKVVEFSLSSVRKVESALQKRFPGERLNGVYPFIWGEISEASTNYLNVSQRIGFRFMLLKLIDSRKTQGDSNIDCHSIALSGSYVKLRLSNED